MVYQQKLVAVIKHKGKILREVDNNTVHLPFLAEYEIFIKNLESRDAVINVSIDGEDVLDNQQIIVRANSSCSLEGFLKGNKTTNKFKFIQKTKQIQDYRGDKVDDGLVRIEYRFVKINQTININYHRTTHWFHPYGCDCPDCKPLGSAPRWPTLPIVTYGGSFSRTTHVVDNDSCIKLSNTNINSSLGNSDYNQVNYCAGSVGNRGENQSLNNSLNAFIPQFDEGITVKGSESNQQFKTSYVDPLEDQSYTIILRLRGYTKDEEPVKNPILVATKRKCSTCGRNNKSNVRFCPDCGTALF